tara:strand:- start:72 stop:290 length:219 start_codon:yes stop_codon:yes gene_type:complete
MKNRKKLNKELLLLTELECQIKEAYDDQEIFDSISEYKQNGLTWFLNQNNYDRAYYEACNLNNNLINLLTGV